MKTAALWEEWVDEDPLGDALPGSFGGSSPGGIPFLADVFGADARIMVEAAFGADVKGNPNLWNFYDITTDVRQADGQKVAITPVGRSDEAAQAQPAGCAFELDNTSGAYTANHPGSKWWPGVKRNTPIRIRLYLGGRYVARFQGYANGWVPSWDTSGNMAVVTVSASGILRRLLQGKSPLRSPLYRANTKATPAPRSHWHMEDGASATQIGNGLPDGLPGSFIGTTVTFGKPGPTGAASAVELISSTRKENVGGSDLIASTSMSFTVSSTAFFGLSVWYRCDPAENPFDTARTKGTFTLSAHGGGDVNRLYLLVQNRDAPPYFWLRAYSGTTLVYDHGTYENSPGLAGADPLDGRWHNFQVKLTQNGANIDVAFLYDGSVVSSGTINTRTVGSFTTVCAPGITPSGFQSPDVYLDSAAVLPNAGGLPVAYSHITVWDTPAMADQQQPGAGYAGETATARLARLCNEESVSIEIAGTSDTAMGPQSIATFVSLLRECETTDDGLLYDGLGPGLGYVTRQFRYNRTASLSPDMAADPPQVGAPFAPADDDQRNRNIMKVDRRNGSSATFEDVDGPLGTDEIQDYDSTLTVNAATDAVLPARAGWEVHKGTVEGFRYPRLNLDLAATPTLVVPWLATPLGGRIDVLNVTSKATQHPPGTVSLLLEGYTETLSPYDWEVTANCSPFAPWRVAQILTSDEYEWRLDSGGSTLAQDYPAGVTSLSVNVADGYLWSTVASDYPRSISVGGIEVVVTAVAGGASPQTFTVQPTVYPLPGGSPVKLWRSPVLAL